MPASWTGAPRCAHALPGHDGPVRAVAPLPCGQRCVSGGADGTARVWNCLMGTCERVLAGHAGTTPFLEQQADLLVKLVYNQTYRVREVK